MRSREDRIAIHIPFYLAANRVDLADRFDGIAEEFDPHRRLVLVRGKHLDDIAANAEGATVKVDVVSFVLNVDEHAEEVVAPELLADLQVDEEPVVALRRANAVNAADRRDDDDVAA